MTGRPRNKRRKKIKDKEEKRKEKEKGERGNNRRRKRRRIRKQRNITQRLVASHLTPALKVQQWPIAATPRYGSGLSLQGPPPSLIGRPKAVSQNQKSKGIDIFVLHLRALLIHLHFIR